MRTANFVRVARRVSDRFLPDTVTVQDKAVVRDTSGGTKTTYVTRPGSVRGRLSSPTDVESAAVAGQVENRSAVVLALPGGTPIDEGDRVVASGQVWVVVALLTIPSATAVGVRVLLREV